MYRKKSVQSGQIALITLLMLVITTTIGLSLISRTTTNLSMTNEVEESSRAFNAAEAGVEEALMGGSGTSGPTGIIGAAGVTYSVTVSSVGGGSGVFQFPKKTQKDATETLWLVNHDANGLPIVTTPVYTAPSIIICWSNEPVIPAMVVTLLYKESSDGSYRVAKTAFDPAGGARASANNFTTGYVAGGCGGSTGTAYKETINFHNDLDTSIDPTQDTLIALRIRPIYSDANIAIDAGVNTIPRQGLSIESTGTTTGGTNRKILVNQQYRSPATVFDAAIYSQNNLVQ